MCPEMVAMLTVQDAPCELLAKSFPFGKGKQLFKGLFFVKDLQGVLCQEIGD